MKLQWFALIPVFAALVACRTQDSELTAERPISGTIAAGESVSFWLSLAERSFAHINLHQHEINLAVHAQGIETDSTDWGAESVYIAAGGAARVRILISATPNQSRQGKFQLRLLSIRPSLPKDSLAMQANRLELSGRKALAQRTAESLPTALADLREAAMLWAEFGDPLREGHSLLAYGIASERSDKYRDADAAYVTASTILKQTGDVLAYRNAHKTWLNFGGRVSENRASIPDLERILAEVRKVGDRRAIRLFTRALARSHSEAGNSIRALELRHEELDLARQLGDKDLESATLASLAGLAMNRHDYASALHSAEQILALARHRGDLSNEISISGFIASIHGQTGNVEPEAAILRQIQQSHEKRGDFTAWFGATASLAENRRRQGNFAEALALLLELQTRSDSFYRLDSAPAAFFTGPGQSGFSIAAARLGQIPRYTRQAFWLADSQRARFFTRDTVDRTNALQQALPNDTLFIEYVSGLTHGGPSYLWIVNNKTIEAAQTATSTQSGDDIKHVAAGLANPNFSAAATRDARIRLGGIILSPLKGKIHGKKLVFVPDEAFAHIPFALLPDPDRDDGSLLGDHHEVSYAPSGQSVAAPVDKNPPKFETDFLIAADPVTNLRDTRLLTKNASPPQPADWTATARSAGILVDGNQLPRLAYATHEVARLRAALKNRRITPLLGFDANRARVLELLPNARFVHIVSHGLADLQKPNGSGLAFSFWDKNGLAQDGFLRFDRIGDSRMDAELVTLAACETAVGRVLSNHGIPSLANAFLRAGARRVISSNWKVDDAATAELMVQFYKNLFSERKPTPAQALWQAQMYVAAQPRWSRPYFWAGFSLTGDWRPL